MVMSFEVTKSDDGDLQFCLEETDVEFALDDSHGETVIGWTRTPEDSYSRQYMDISVDIQASENRSVFQVTWSFERYESGSGNVPVVISYDQQMDASPSVEIEYDGNTIGHLYSADISVSVNEIGEHKESQYLDALGGISIVLLFLLGLLLIWVIVSTGAFWREEQERKELWESKERFCRHCEAQAKQRDDVMCHACGNMYFEMRKNRRYYFFLPIRYLVGLLIFMMSFVYWLFPLLINEAYKLGIGVENATVIEMIDRLKDPLADPLVIISIVWGMLPLLLLWLSMEFPKMYRFIKQIPILGGATKSVQVVARISARKGRFRASRKGLKKILANLRGSFRLFNQAIIYFFRNYLVTIGVIVMRLTFAPQLESQFGLSPIDPIDTLIAAGLALSGQFLAFYVCSVGFDLTRNERYGKLSVFSFLAVVLFFIAATSFDSPYIGFVVLFSLVTFVAGLQFVGALFSWLFAIVVFGLLISVFVISILLILL